MKRALQFRIYPTKNQEVILNRTLSTCRHLYNDALAERKRQSQINKLRKEFDVFPWGKLEWIDYYEQKRKLTATKTPIQKKLHSQILQDVIKRVNTSFKNFFNGFGYPRFQGRNRYNSFAYPQSGFQIKDGKLNLSKSLSENLMYFDKLTLKLPPLAFERKSLLVVRIFRQALR